MDPILELPLLLFPSILPVLQVSNTVSSCVDSRSDNKLTKREPINEVGLEFELHVFTFQSLFDKQCKKQRVKI